MTVLALIGARSGSKGVPNKNIKLLGGKPLLAWVIEAAKKSKYVNRVIISTDSEEYAKVARDYGAETPFLRPAEFSGDKSTDFDYVNHAVNWLRENESYEPDLVVRGMPTVPFQQPGDFDGAVEALLNDPEADSSIVMALASQHPAKALKLVPDGKGGELVVGYISGDPKDAAPLLRQGYAKAYFRANLVAFRPHILSKYNSITGERIRPYIVPQDRSVDIDSEVDFMVAEYLKNNLNK
ncbi:MAG: acylneuraminate cytidylyltransferase family protein [Candidatus Harrisonbacteria bacterium]|nr:acylneuraminate cytidylyltransferase family protein [Candidatus Harrisonbacteria bacterium]